MKYLFLVIMTSCVAFAGEKDSIVCFPKNDIVRLANKIQLLRDSIQYLQAVTAAQDTLIKVSEIRMDIYNKQLDNTLQVIDYCEKQNKELEKIIQELQPSWYDNKMLWFLSGVGTVVCVVLAIQ
jgi:hypothetical protein